MLVLAIFGITGIIWMIAGDEGGMERAMIHYAPAEETGLPADEYRDMAVMMTEYLTGRRDTFQFTLVDMNGESYNCFHNYEEIHMADCRNLLTLDRKVEIFCLVLGTAGLILVAVLRKPYRRRFAEGGLKGLMALGILAVLLVAWAALNFDGFFVTFHRLAFRNDLWLLDPETDMLIRLMPESLFVHLGLKGLPLAAAWVGLLALACVIIKKEWKGLLPED